MREGIKMVYKVKIKYWNGWEECSVWLTRVVSAYDCVSALKFVLEETGFEDEDIEEINIILEG
jgi:hypothetical protein